MTITILAIAFLLVLFLVAIAGYKTIIKRGSTPAASNMEKCAICRETFDKQELALRQIGDYKLLYFCKKCVAGLYADSGMKN